MARLPGGKRMRGGIWLFALIVVARAATAQADSFIEIKSGDFTFQVDVRAQANLIYHVDCLSRAAQCTSEVFEQLWRDHIGLGSGDRKLLDEWAAIKRQIEREAGDRTLPIKASVPILGTRDDFSWNKIQYVGFLSSDASELERGWSALMAPATATRLVEILNHFRPRFETWWRTHEAEAANFVPGLEAALKKGRAPELLRAAARFYRSELGDRRLFIHLFLQPKIPRPNSQATVVGPHLVVEIEPNENPEERVGVIVHELAHHLFARMPAERKAWLADTLFASGPAGPPAWYLLDEIQATVIGNIMAGRNAMPPESFKKRLDAARGFYNDDAIDLGARASERVFDEALKKGRAMRASFADEYVAALQAGMGDKLATPSLYLRNMIVNVDDDESQWPQKLRRAVRSSSTWSLTPLADAKLIDRLDRYPGASAVVMALIDQAPKLAPAYRSLGIAPDGLTATLGSSRGLIFIAQRTPLAYSFVFLAHDDAVMNGLIAAFQVCQLKSGVCARIE